MDGGTVMEGTEGTFGGGMVQRRTCTIPSYLASEPFDPKHVSVPTHRKPGYPVRTAKRPNTPPLEDPFSCRCGGGSAADRNIFGMLGVVIRHGSAWPSWRVGLLPHCTKFVQVPARCGLLLKAVAGDPLRGDVFVLHPLAHFVANVGVTAFVPGSAVSAFCDGHVVGPPAGRGGSAT